MCRECSLNNQEHQCPSCRASQGFDVTKLARAYRALVLWFGVQLVMSLANQVLPKTPVIAALSGLVVLATFVALTMYAYRTAAALGSSVPVLWAVAMFVPCVNAITLLVLSSKATSACRERGIVVGLLGPKV
jgi:hypothetical protein